MVQEVNLYFSVPKEPGLVYNVGFTKSISAFKLNAYEHATIQCFRIWVVTS